MHAISLDLELRVLVDSVFLVRLHQERFVEQDKSETVLESAGWALR